MRDFDRRLKRLEKAVPAKGFLQLGIPKVAGTEAKANDQNLPIMLMSAEQLAAEIRALDAATTPEGDPPEPLPASLPDVLGKTAG